MRPIAHSCPTHIRAYQGYNQTLGIRNYEDVYAYLVKCPEVRGLEISHTIGGCVVGPRSDFAFQFRRGAQFPPLEELTALHYGWEQETPYRDVPAIFSKPRRNAELWRDAMDWGQLKRLDVDLPPEGFLDTFRGRLPGLEELTWRTQLGTFGNEITLCDFSADGDALRLKYEDFLEELPSLKKLRISGTGKHLNLTRIVQTHSGSLRDFGLNELEGDCRRCSNVSRPFLSFRNLHMLNDTAPHLRTLSLDVQRYGTHAGGDWPWNTLRDLAKFPQVSEMSLHFDLEDRTFRQPIEECNEGVPPDQWDEETWMSCSKPGLIKPELNGTEALMIFQNLRKAKAGVDLERLGLEAGNVGRPKGGGLRYHPEYNARNNPVKFECMDHLEGFDGRHLGACCTESYERRHRWNDKRLLYTQRFCEDQQASDEEQRDRIAEYEGQMKFDQARIGDAHVLYDEDKDDDDKDDGFYF